MRGTSKINLTTTMKKYRVILGKNVSPSIIAIHTSDSNEALFNSMEEAQEHLDVVSAIINAQAAFMFSKSVYYVSIGSDGIARAEGVTIQLSEQDNFEDYFSDVRDAQRCADKYNLSRETMMRVK